MRSFESVDSDDLLFGDRIGFRGVDYVPRGLYMPVCRIWFGCKDLHWALRHHSLQSDLSRVIQIPVKDVRVWRRKERFRQGAGDASDVGIACCATTSNLGVFAFVAFRR